MTRISSIYFHISDATSSGDMNITSFVVNIHYLVGMIVGEYSVNKYTFIPTKYTRSYIYYE